MLGLNEALLARADAAKLVKTGKVRADTTVVSANVEYPTDSGLLARAVRRMSGLVRRIRAVGAARRTPFRSYERAASFRSDHGGWYRAQHRRSSDRRRFRWLCHSNAT